MRPVIGWALGVSVIMSIASILVDDGIEAGAVAEKNLTVEHIGVPTNAEQGWAQGAGSLKQRVLPMQFGASDFSPSKRDIFEVAMLPAPQVILVKEPVTPAVEPNLPTPPLINYRFLGRMVGPEGGVRVYLAQGESVTEVAVGATLTEGYIIESIKNDSIQILFPPLQYRAEILIPNAHRDPGCCAQQ